MYAFREDDLGLELTALATLLAEPLWPLLAGLPLALSSLDPALEVSARRREAALRQVSRSMRATEQAPGQDVLAHGWAVRSSLRALVDHLEGTVDLSTDPAWRLPKWLDEHRDLLLARLLPWRVLERYAVMHDCGKPSCLVVEDGRRRFPDHALVSAHTWRRLSASDPDRAFAAAVERLVASDMDVHLLRGEGVPAFAARPEAVSLLLTALAEVHSNAALFGGLGSDSFRAKWKHLDRRGRAVLAVLSASSDRPSVPSPKESHRVR